MKRFALISLGIGLVVALLVVALHFFAVYEPLSDWLDNFYAVQGIYPAGAGDRLIFIEVLWIVALSIWITWCLCDLTQGAQKVIILVVFLFLVGALSPCLALYGKFFSPFATFSALILSASAAFAFCGTELGNRKRKLEMLLGRRISHDTFDKLMLAPKAPSFESQKREVTVLTCRLYNRSELMEQLEPKVFLQMTNLFRKVISHYLISQGAYLDEAGPDLIRAYFGLLQPVKSHADVAAKVSLGLQPALKQINQECHNRYLQELHVGAGLSSGEVVSGIYGSKENFFLSGVGPQVDFSRRLSKANQRYGSSILIGPETFKMVNGFAEVRPMEMFFDPDSGEMLEIYEILALKEDFSANEKEMRDHYWQGVIHYREEKFTEAIEYFNKARVPGKIDGPLEYFVMRAQEKLQSSQQKDSNPQKPGLSEGGHSRLLGNL